MDLSVATDKIASHLLQPDRHSSEGNAINGAHCAVFTPVAGGAGLVPAFTSAAVATALTNYYAQYPQDFWPRAHRPAGGCVLRGCARYGGDETATRETEHRACGQQSACIPQLRLGPDDPSPTTRPGSLGPGRADAWVRAWFNECSRGCPAAPAATPATAASPGQGASLATSPEVESGGVGVREFQGDDVGQVLRLLARQSKINMVVSEAVTGTVTMRLEDVTALQAIAIIVKAKGLFMDKIDNVYYIKTGAERTSEPTESDSYQFSYGRAKDVAPLLASQLASKDAPQVDERTNTVFYRETRSNIDNIRKLLVQIDRPTKQVMIEARLVEVNANPKQSYGINWAGVVGSSSSAQTFRYGGTTPSSDGSTQTVTFNNGVPQLADFVQGAGNRPAVTGNNSGNLNPLSVALAS